MLILSHKTGKITNVIVNEGREIIVYNILQNLKRRYGVIGSARPK